MRRAIVKIILLCTLLSIIASAQAALASEIADFTDQVIAWQTDPEKRLREVEAELAKIREAESGLANQYGVPGSEIQIYENYLEKLVNTYNSIYFLQKRMEGDNSFLLDDERLRRLASVKPPYSFAFYMDVALDVDRCSDDYNNQLRIIENSKKRQHELKEQRGALEREFRLSFEKSELSSENRIKYSFALRRVKAMLENNLAEQTFYEVSSKLATTQSGYDKEKLDALQAVLKNVSSNVKVSAEDFEYLDSLAFSKIKALKETVTQLNKRFTELSEMRRMPVRGDMIRRFRILSEQQVIENETLSALDLVELWSSARVSWHLMQELLTGQLSIAQEKETLAKTEEYIMDTDAVIREVNESLQSLRTAEMEMARRLKTTKNVRDDEMWEYSNFLTNIEESKRRLLSYLVTLAALRNQFDMLRTETQRIMGEADTSTKLGYLWTEKMGSLLNYEIWSTGDYSITVRKLLVALIILILGWGLTSATSRLLRRNLVKRDSMSLHSCVLVERLVLYAGLMFSALVALWTLHIPLTAFAFLGGAAAIALGFGAQKILGDTMSGLLLLFQRKIRIGDYVVIGDKDGVVTEITLQNTVLVCEQSKHLIIPNSHVLDSAILNLTLDNTFSRTTISVTLPYGEDTARAAELIRAILSENRFILKSPPFRIVFSDFEAHATKLTAVFFFDLSSIFESDLQSSVRTKILELFRENNIKQNLPPLFE